MGCTSSSRAATCSRDGDVASRARPDVQQVQTGTDVDPIEDDRADSHTSAAPHIHATGDTWRFDMHTVEDNLRLALKGERRARKTLFWRDSAEERGRLDRILETIRLTAHRGRLAGSLAHGQKQWLEIGMVVATEEFSRGSLGAGGSLITRPEIMASVPALRTTCSGFPTRSLTTSRRRPTSRPTSSSSRCTTCSGRS